MSTSTTEEHVQDPSQDKTIQLPCTIQSSYGNFVLSIPPSASLAGRGFAVKLPKDFNLNPLAHDFHDATNGQFLLEQAPPYLRIGNAPVDALISAGIKPIAERTHRTRIELPSLEEVVKVLTKLLEQPGYAANPN